MKRKVVVLLAVLGTLAVATFFWPTWYVPFRGSVTIAMETSWAVLNKLANAKQLAEGLAKSNLLDLHN